ncbi:DUF1989 domain-containing protein [Terrabacter sp. AAH1]
MTIAKDAPTTTSAPPTQPSTAPTPIPGQGRHFGAGGPVFVPAYGGDVELTRLAPQTGAAFLLRAGERLVVVDPTGEQVSDFFAVMAEDHDEWLSSGRTIDYANSTIVTTGTVLYSNRSTPMATVVEDTCGRHDLLLTPCSQQTFDLLYPELGGAYHPSCFENLASNMSRFGVASDRIGTTLNIFMNVWAERNGELHIDPPTSRAGDRFVVRAEADLVVGLTACSAEKSNNGVCKPIDYRIEA